MITSLIHLILNVLLFLHSTFELINLIEDIDTNMKFGLNFNQPKMKKIILLAVVFSILLLWIAGQSDWHLDRNKHNKLPNGHLKKIKNDTYEDNDKVVWELQPAIKNKFHQPEEVGETVAQPYPNVEDTLTYDAKNPNLKFLSKSKNGGSYEAILQPNGVYLTTGLKRGTYNYGHPSGFFGNLKHIFLDVLPHFVNSKYKS